MQGLKYYMLVNMSWTFLGSFFGLIGNFMTFFPQLTVVSLGLLQHASPVFLHICLEGAIFAVLYTLGDYPEIKFANRWFGRASRCSRLRTLPN